MNIRERRNYFSVSCDLVIYVIDFSAVKSCSAARWHGISISCWVDKEFYIHGKGWNYLFVITNKQTKFNESARRLAGVLAEAFSKKSPRINESSIEGPAPRVRYNRHAKVRLFLDINKELSRKCKHNHEESERKHQKRSLGVFFSLSFDVSKVLSTAISFNNLYHTPRHRSPPLCLRSHIFDFCA